MGFFEFILIFIAIIIFIKPEDLPSFLNKIGRIYGQLKENYEYLIRSLRKTEYDIKGHLPESLSFKDQTKPAIKEKTNQKKANS